VTPEGSKNSMPKVRGSFAGTEIPSEKPSPRHERFAGHFEQDVMEAGGSSSKLWIVADGQRVERAGGTGVVTSGGPVVFVDDAAEDVAPADLAGAWLIVAEQWGRELASAVRARLVVVTHVGAEHQFEVTFRVDEQVVETLFPDGADEAFGERVRLR